MQLFIVMKFFLSSKQLRSISTKLAFNQLLSKSLKVTICQLCLGAKPTLRLSAIFTSLYTCNKVLLHFTNKLFYEVHNRCAFIAHFNDVKQSTRTRSIIWLGIATAGSQISNVHNGYFQFDLNIPLEQLCSCNYKLSRINRNISSRLSG